MSCDVPLLLWGWCWDWEDPPPDDDRGDERAPEHDDRGDVHGSAPRQLDADPPPQMARDLDNTMNPPFLQPQPRGLSPLPPPQGAEWSPWAPAAAASSAASTARTPSPLPPRLPSPPRDGALTLAWARDVLFLVDRTPSLSTSALALAAVPLALHLRATFAASGAYPHLVPPSPRAAFRDFEAAARAGHAPAWFRLARDYEAFADPPHALDCLARGARAHDPAALHRLGIAHLLGQLSLAPNPATALPFLSKAAARASLQCPQPAYVFALILLGEFSVPVPAGLLREYLPAGQSAGGYARALLERAAALHFAPAQYKLGHAFEFAVPAQAFPFDPLLSVQWYSLASQAGEAEADMALSKWFLCGAEGAFDKDEALARTFAAKAAAKGLPAGEFAMGYYCEAAAHGNTDAAERLRALAEPAAQALGRTEHDMLTGDKLVRKRTQARQRSDREGGGTSPYTTEPPSYANPHPEPALANPYGAPPPTAPYGAPAPTAGRAPPSAYGYQPPPPQQQHTRVMELARKSSLADAGHVRSGSAGGFDYRPGQGDGRGRAGAASAPPPLGPQGYGTPPPGPQYGTPPPGQGQGYNGGGGGGGGGRGRIVPGPREGSLPPGQRVHPAGREGSLPPGAGGGRGRGFALSDGGPAQGAPPPSQSRPGSAASGGRVAGVPPGRRPGTAGPGGRGDGGGNGGGGGGQGAGRGDGGGIVTTVGGGGPATFAEMGFTGAKAEDKECVVM
ncbi:hypothetical protein B0H17DRAFT_1204438 [Mycena rosella]|uniref:Uncharacterized protein n=1 Tax=Mycena rosella TaxID=1033263 RepID=A0AAD7GB94_MYCRO|nr:hypothetical protein B0H17DRAFT_1204438 [Mycena rosella]